MNAAGIGVAATAYDGIVSSGDVSRSLIAAWAGRRMLHIGPERDQPVFAGLEVFARATAEDAEVTSVGVELLDPVEVATRAGAAISEGDVDVHSVEPTVIVTVVA